MVRFAQRCAKNAQLFFVYKDTKETKMFFTNITNFIGQQLSIIKDNFLAGDQIALEKKKNSKEYGGERCGIRGNTWENDVEYAGERYGMRRRAVWNTQERDVEYVGNRDSCV